MKIFLCGDVMTGRGVDQVMPNPCPPDLHEPFMNSAVGYLRLAEQANGPIPRPVDLDYIWGAAIEEWARVRPQARVINLETSITSSDEYWPKGINYRMSPENAACLKRAAIDCCALANNHVLDWGSSGLLDTLDALGGMGVKTAGAGRNLSEAMAPAALDIGGEGRLLVFSIASVSSGVPDDWAATADAPGVNLLSSFSEDVASAVARQIIAIRRPGDFVVVSIHWGPNWGYEVPNDERRFAHALIEQAGVSIVHGHSSHHAKAIEVFNDRLILYGCGDFLNDYEGIGSEEAYRGDLALMYFADLDANSGAIQSLEMTPLAIRRLRLVRPSAADVAWLRETLNRESAPFGVHVTPVQDGRFAVSWERGRHAKRRH